MQNMLGISLCEVRGLFKDLMDKLCGEDQQKWLEALKHFLRGEPTWAEEMIYTPLEWSENLGGVCFKYLQEQSELYNKGHGGNWRLPTDKELDRALRKMKPTGFELQRYYWTSTPHFDGRGMTITYTYDGCGGLGSKSSLEEKYPTLRLCRPIKLPE